MQRFVLILTLLALAAPARALQPGATGAVVIQNATIDVGTIDAGDSGAGTTRAANKNIIKQRTADDCTAQTDGVIREVCVDYVRGVYACSTTTCNAAGWTHVGVRRWAELTGTLGNSQQMPWGDVGLARSAAGVAKISDGSSGAGDLAVLDLDTQAVSVADNGDGGTAATFNLDPTASYVEITCSDAQGCVGTLQETSAREGRVALIVNVSSANKVSFSDVSNVLALSASPLILDAGKSVSLSYDGAIWGQRANGVPFVVLQSDGTFIANAATINLDSRFTYVCVDAAGAGCDAGELCRCTITPGGSFTLVGTIDKADLPAEVSYDDEANVFTANQKVNDAIKFLFGSSGVWSVQSGGTDFTITRESGAGAIVTAAPATITGTWDFGGGSLIVPTGTASAPTTAGAIYLKTNYAQSPTSRPSIGNGSTAIQLRERNNHGWLLTRGYNGNCTAASTPDACCTGSGMGTCASDHCTAAATPDACCTRDRGGTCGGQEIADGTLSSGTPNNWEAIAWGVEEVDTDGYHSTASASGANTKVTIPGIFGAYQITCQLEFAADADGQRCCAITGSFVGLDLVVAESCGPARATSGATAARAPCIVTTVTNTTISADYKCWAWSSAGVVLDVLRSHKGAINSGGYGSFFAGTLIAE